MIWVRLELFHLQLGRKVSILKTVPAFPSIVPAFLYNLSTLLVGPVKDFRFELSNMEKLPKLF